MRNSQVITSTPHGRILFVVTILIGAPLFSAFALPLGATQLNSVSSPVSVDVSGFFNYRTGDFPTNSFFHIPVSFTLSEANPTVNGSLSGPRQRLEYSFSLQTVNAPQTLDFTIQVQASGGFFHVSESDDYGAGAPFTITFPHGWTVTTSECVANLTGMPPSSSNTSVDCVVSKDHQNAGCANSATETAFTQRIVGDAITTVTSLFVDGAVGVVDSHGNEVCNNVSALFGGTSTIHMTVKSPPPTLAQPTNLKANQVSDASGAQIRLTWDYQDRVPIDGFRLERVPLSSLDSLSSPALSTGSELSVHPDLSVCQSGHCTFVDRSFVTADNSTLVPFATYSYRVRAFQGSTDSDPSNVATCFQLRLETDNNNSTMQATFTPLATLTPNMNSLQQAAQLFHFNHFNWVSLMTHVPSVATLGLVDHNGQLLSPPPPPLVDPPLGGWLYRAADSLPYYWNEEAGLDPAYSLQQNTTNLATEFRDTPYSILLSFSSDYFQFHTLLVGVEGAIGATPPRFHNLASFSWSSNFSRLSGGITDVRFSNIDPPTDPGPGGVFNTKTINDADLSLDVRQVLIQAGAQGVSTAPKVDTDTPTTAAFLFGPQATNGWYTGPVMATLIATDIDGPSDVASTTYNIDGGSVLAYSRSFGISGDGIHSIQFGSTDQAGNAETPRPSQTIKIDATPPSISCVSNPSTLWPPNGKTVSVMVSGTISDSTSGVDGGSVGFAVTNSEGQIQKARPIPLGSSGDYSFPVSLVASRFGSDKDGRKYTILVSARDNAGNINSCSTVVTVPHDQGH